ncbi:molecular chaperone [Erythrobacter sp. WG]|uniref:fimbrial biogenesis chaperone n=1 Tax=Erythrobacter sp. WG TaxID=2985510 RepID=UPI00226FCB07|nr:fimbria/pilus periplasmic chaperone [Erythrobacter sp. WG]MCX9145953.1 fimbria/pilus periplasmic chaperone [Erythrobacter sp. WG]
MNISTRLSVLAERNLRALRRLATAFAAGLALVLSGALQAYEVTPMRVFLQPGGGQNSATITINNIRTEPLPVEIQVLRRVVKPDGEQVFEPAEEEFITFPPQVQIPAGQSQAIRIQYVGDLGETAQAFVVQVTEVPVNKLEGTGIQFTYNFGVAVYVQPPRARARLAVSDTAVADGILRFKVANSGNDYGFLTGQALEYNVGGTRVTLTPDDVATLVANPIVPPGATREFALPLDRSIAAGAGGPTEVRLLRGES